MLYPLLICVGIAVALFLVIPKPLLDLLPKPPPMFSNPVKIQEIFYPLLLIPCLAYEMIYVKIFEHILRKPVQERFFSVRKILTIAGEALAVYMISTYTISFESPFLTPWFVMAITLIYFAVRLFYVREQVRAMKVADELEMKKEADRAAAALIPKPQTPPNVAPLLALATEQLINQKNVIIGTSQDSVPIFYREKRGQEERFRNTYVIGTPNSGKSTCFANLNAQDFYYGNGVIVLSAERRLFDRLLSLIPKERMDDLIYFDPSDLTAPIIGFNPFTRGADEDVYQKIGETIIILTRAMGGEGITVKPIIENAVAAVAHRPHATIADLMRLINPADKTVRASLKNDSALDENTRDFWKRYDETTYYRKSYDSVYNRFDPFARHPISTALATSSFSFKTVMNSGRHIIFLDLSRLRGNAPITMGQLLLASIEQSLLVRDDMREEDCIPYYLYIDEFQKYATDSQESLIALFNGARKYRLGITIAHQTTANIPPELMDTIDSDTSTKIVMHVEDKDARRFAPQLRIKKAGRDSFDHEILQDLKIGQAYVRTPTHTIGVLTTMPATPFVPLSTPIPADVLKARSKQNFGIDENPETPAPESAPPPTVPPPPQKKKKSFGITFE